MRKSSINNARFGEDVQVVLRKRHSVGPGASDHHNLEEEQKKRKAELRKTEKEKRMKF